MKKIIKKECTVGFKCWFEDEPDKVWYEWGQTDNGFCFKDDEAFSSHSNDTCYIPENDYYWEIDDEDIQQKLDYEEAGYNYQSFLFFCDDVPHLAEIVYYSVDWQFPETYMNELSDETDLECIFYDVSGDNDDEFLRHLADIYDEDKFGSDWSDYYNFYLAHKKE